MGHRQTRRLERICIPSTAGAYHVPQRLGTLPYTCWRLGYNTRVEALARERGEGARAPCSITCENTAPITAPRSRARLERQHLREAGRGDHLDDDRMGVDQLEAAAAARQRLGGGDEVAQPDRGDEGHAAHVDDDRILGARHGRERQRDHVGAGDVEAAGENDPGARALVVNRDLHWDFRELAWAYHI